MRFSAPVQTGPGAHPASCTMGTGSFPGVNSGRGVTLTPHPLLVPWSRKGRAIPLLPLLAVRPVQSLSACTRVHFTFLYQSPVSCQEDVSASGSSPVQRSPIQCGVFGCDRKASIMKRSYPTRGLFHLTPLGGFFTTKKHRISQNTCKRHKTISSCLCHCFGYSKDGQIFHQIWHEIYKI